METQIRSVPTALTSLELRLVSHSPSETLALGATLGALVHSGDVIGLQGELGSGKTQLVKGLARGLDVAESVHSPTFILANEYRSGRMPLFHVDAYRVSGGDEALAFGLEDYLYDGGVTCVEWADRILDALPSEYFWIEFDYVSESERAIKFKPTGLRNDELLLEFKAKIGK